MRKIYIPYYLIIAATIAFALYSCAPQKKAVTSVKNEIKTIDNQLTDQGKTLDDLEIKRKNKQELNEIDDTAGLRIQKFIGNTKLEIVNLVDQNTVLIGEAVVKKEDWDKLKDALALSQESLKKIIYRVIFINDFINRNTVVKLDQDVLFEPGQYTATSKVASSIGSFFEPAAKEIDYFVKKYPEFPLSLVITAKGYADGTSIAEGSKLYNDLKERLRLTGKDPDQKELNKELSRARAEEIINLFKKFTTGRSSDGGNIKNILYLYEGKGDAFPYKNISDYKTNDPRRRVVFLFWSVFPE